MPRTKSKKEEPKLIGGDLPYIGTEAYKKLRTNVLFSLTDNGECRVIGVTSSQPEDGKSLTAVNLAWSMAQLPDKKVLLIDGDLRRPSIHSKLGFEASPGLSNILSNIGNDSKSSHTYSDTEDGEQFDVITAGDIPPNPSELLCSERMQALISNLRKCYDYIIIDLPPIDAVTDAQAVGNVTDGMLVVVRENFCRKDVLAECIRQLEYAKIHILGFVLNGTNEGGKGYDYNRGKYGKYRYYYKYSRYKYY